MDPDRSHSVEAKVCFDALLPKVWKYDAFCIYHNCLAPAEGYNRQQELLVHRRLST